MSYNVLFLDFDGPLWSDRVIYHHPDNTDENHPTRFALKEAMIANGDSFGAASLTYWRMDAVAVHMLNQIMEIQPFFTVISSGWRDFCSRKTIEHILDLNGLNLQLHQHWMTDLRPPDGDYDIFQRPPKEERGHQISRWLKNHDGEVRNYAILDDPGSGGSLIDDSFVRHIGLSPNHVVLVDHAIGMERFHFKQLRDLLIV